MQTIFAVPAALYADFRAGKSTKLVARDRGILIMCAENEVEFRTVEAIDQPPGCIDIFATIKRRGFRTKRRHSTRKA